MQGGRGGNNYFQLSSNIEGGIYDFHVVHPDIPTMICIVTAFQYCLSSFSMIMLVSLPDSRIHHSIIIIDMFVFAIY